MSGSVGDWITHLAEPPSASHGSLCSSWMLVCCTLWAGLTGVRTVCRRARAEGNVPGLLRPAQRGAAAQGLGTGCRGTLRLCHPQSSTMHARRQSGVAELLDTKHVTEPPVGARSRAAHKGLWGSQTMVLVPRRCIDRGRDEKEVAGEDRHSRS